jgi:ATP-dependent Clp protease adaptor protein ClpS
MNEESPLENVMVAPKEKQTTKTRRVPPYNVILLNDDHHTMDFVIEVLCKALGYTVERSYQLMMQAHNQGRAIVWTAPKEVAELKAEQILTFHQKLDDGRELGPLGCEIEPAPGG